MPVTDMTRIEDAPKRVHELSPEGTSESARNARCDDSRTNKLKSIFLIVGIVLCVICGTANPSKAQIPLIPTLSTSSTPYASTPHYDNFNLAAQDAFDEYYEDAPPNSPMSWYAWWGMR
jgi:hypothetical protein